MSEAQGTPLCQPYFPAAKLATKGRSDILPQSGGGPFRKGCVPASSSCR